ncbi:hypothetical protein B0A52_07711 [Exophiala mesophila]|uniref:Major facilitator superfamily (MFS) profile domain-containing protein n=1 Tax=Exophiala mesophila TaxID=212818 RepID=A0A438MVJ1_EXOME|nr:hypothetical protein B0A52_07711 [Exophiala mesophila]
MSRSDQHTVSPKDTNLGSDQAQSPRSPNSLEPPTWEESRLKEEQNIDINTDPDTSKEKAHALEGDVAQSIIINDSNAKLGDNESRPPINPTDPSQFPDGGLQAWLCVVGAVCGLIASFGWINAIGIFQEHYQRNQLRDYTPQEIAWIPSLEGSMMWANGLWVGRVYDNYGPRYILCIGTFLHVFGLMMASISHKYYQILLAQGVCSPLGAAMIFYPCSSATATWFFRRRAAALGMVAAGASIGGVIFPIMVERLVPRVGFGWTMRTCAFLILAIMLVCIATVRSRIPPSPRPLRASDFTSPWKEIPFTLLTVGTFATMLGLFLPFTFLVVEARSRGVPRDLSIYLISILNGASTFGRTVPNYIADKVGRFNVLVVFATLNAIMVLAVWLPTDGVAAVVCFAVFFGFTSGAVFGLVPPLIAQISPISQIGLRTGLLFGIGSVAILVGSPIGGQLIVANDGRYTTMQGFSGAMCSVGCGIYFALWLKMGGFKKRKV